MELHGSIGSMPMASHGREGKRELMLLMGMELMLELMLAMGMPRLA